MRRLKPMKFDKVSPVIKRKTITVRLPPANKSTMTNGLHFARMLNVMFTFEICEKTFLIDNDKRAILLCYKPSDSE